MQRRNNSVEILVLPRIKKRRKFLKLGVGYIHRFMFIYYNIFAYWQGQLLIYAALSCILFLL